MKYAISSLMEGAEPEDMEEQSRREAAAQEAQRLEAAQQEAGQLMETISTQIRRGNRPEYILTNAIRCISLLADKPGWGAANQAQLDEVYHDLDQQSLLVDTAIVEAQRLERKSGEALKKADRTMTARIVELEKAYTAMQTARDALRALMPTGIER